VSDPSTPTEVGSIALSSFGESVQVSGRYAYVIDGGFKIMDVSDPSAPTEVGNLATGLIRSMVVLGRYAYAVASSELKVIDLSNPNAPNVVGGLALTDARSIYVSGRYAYVVDDTDLRVVDISDPSAAISVSALPIGISPEFVFVSGRYAYTVDPTTNSMRTIDLSNPSLPVQVGSRSAGVNLLNIYVAGRYAYAVDRKALAIFDVTGAEVTSLMAHSLEAGNLQVRNDVIAQGQLQVTGGMNVGSGGIFSDGDIGISGTLAIANDIAPISSPANLVQLYAEDVSTSELKVRDEAGNITALSPHNFSLIGEPSEPMAWSYFSRRAGTAINVDMLQTVRLVEQISGEKLVHFGSENPIPRNNGVKMKSLMQRVEELETLNMELVLRNQEIQQKYRGIKKEIELIQSSLRGGQSLDE